MSTQMSGQSSFTETQLEIIHSPKSRIVIEAQPGSGKTRVLVEKVIHAFSRYRPEQIVAITFTEKAAQEIKQRLAPHVPPYYLDRAWISTIHGFCYRMLKTHCWEANLSPKFSVLSQEQSIFLQHIGLRQGMGCLTDRKATALHVCVSEYGIQRLTDILKDLFLQRELCLDVDRYVAPDAKSDFIWEHLKAVFQYCFSLYQESKKTRDALDFDDLLIECVNLFKNNPSLLKHYQTHFRVILVDEFQDTNFLQTTLIELLTSPAPGQPHPLLMVVGDPKQSIYRFRGADIDLFFRVKEDILKNSGSCFEMVENFRSEKTLTQFINTLFEPLMGSHFMASVPKANVRGAGSIEYWTPQDGGRVQEAHWLATHVKKMGEQMPWSDMAILFRAMTYADLYEAALTQANIPWIRTDAGFLFEHGQIQSLISALRWVLNPKDDVSLWNLLSQPWFGISKKMRLSLATDRLKKSCSLEDALAQVSSLKNVYSKLKKLKNLKERISIYEWFKTLDLPITVEVAHFLKLVLDFEEQNPQYSWADFLIYCAALKDHRVANREDTHAPDQNGIRLLTIHQAKGLEFPIVYLPDLSYVPRREYPFVLIDKNLGIGLKTFQRPNEWAQDATYEAIRKKENEKEKEESTRLLYVAMTRAKRHLILSHSALKPRSSSWAAWIDLYQERLDPFIKRQEFIATQGNLN